MKRNQTGDKTVRLFLSNVIPSIIGFALSGVYTIVDGFFIGHSMGDDGLAAITVGFPICACIQAIGTGVGVAGGIQYSIAVAKKNTRQSLEYFTATILLMSLISLVLTFVFYSYADSILHVLGASGVIQDMAVKYVLVIALGTCCQLFATGLMPFVRNMQGANYAMFTMILGFSINIVLDYVLVWLFPFGMYGAALATVIGQLATFIALVFYIVRHRYTCIKMPVMCMLKIWKQTVLSAISPFGLSFSSQLTLIFMNKYLFLYGSGLDVAAYGCMDYILSIAYFLIQGVGDGSQPLISFYHGKKDHHKEMKISKMAYTTAFGIATLFAIVVFAQIHRIGYLFGASQLANEKVMYYLPWFLVTLILLSYSRISTTCFYATEKNIFSYVLVYGETLFSAIFLAILPEFLGVTGVWMAVPVSQIIIFIISLSMRRYQNKKISHDI